MKKTTPISRGPVCSFLLLLILCACARDEYKCDELCQAQVAEEQARFIQTHLNSGECSSATIHAMSYQSLALMSHADLRATIDRTLSHCAKGPDATPNWGLDRIGTAALLLVRRMAILANPEENAFLVSELGSMVRKQLHDAVAANDTRRMRQIADVLGLRSIDTIYEDVPERIVEEIQQYDGYRKVPESKYKNKVRLYDKVRYQLYDIGLPVFEAFEEYDRNQVLVIDYLDDKIRWLQKSLAHADSPDVVQQQQTGTKAETIDYLHDKRAKAVLYNRFSERKLAMCGYVALYAGELIRFKPKANLHTTILEQDHRCTYHEHIILCRPDSTGEHARIRLYSTTLDSGTNVGQKLTSTTARSFYYGAQQLGFGGTINTYRITYDKLQGLGERQARRSLDPMLNSNCSFSYPPWRPLTEAGKPIRNPN